MSVKKCPFCGNTLTDNKVYRLAMYIGDTRIRIFPQGTITYREAKKQTEIVANAYLMAEVLDGDTGRIISAMQWAESLYETDENNIPRKKSNINHRRTRVDRENSIDHEH